MNTPIYDFLKEYAGTHPVRPHMPGHKGKAPLGAKCLANAYSMDITEIDGADSLFEASGIIAESEENARKLFNTSGTFYSTGGSTLCIQTMLYLMKLEGRKIFAMRNAHRAFLNACILLDIEVEWIIPPDSNGILSGRVPILTLEKMLTENKKPAAVYITSPDYLGNMAEISLLSKICKQHKARLLVDNAHGAHLAFTEKNMHPISLGADLCCDSAHKMLPALTGAAYIHTSDSSLVPKIKNAMSVFGSSSPSYLILASLDLCNLYLSSGIKEDIIRVNKLVHDIKTNLSTYYRFAFGDSMHLTIFASSSGTTGYDLAKFLISQRIFPEYYDKSVLVLLLSPTMETFAIKSIMINLLNFAQKNGCKWSPEESDVPTFSKLTQALSMREAEFLPYESIDVNDSEGRIAGPVSVPCPPAIPIVVGGEVIDKNTIKLFNYYGIKKVNVIKEKREN